MKYPQLVSTPAVVKEWLEAELECLGIDSAAYARTVLSLLSRDTIDPAEVIQSGYVLVANKGGRGTGGPNGPCPSRTREEELKRAEVIECLRSASEDHGGIRLLVDQLISMLKQLPAASEPSADTVVDTSRRPAAGNAPASDDPVLRYEAAFPALSRESPPSVIPLTFFSKMGRSAVKGPPAAAAATDLWRTDLATTAVWPTDLDLSLLLAPPAYTTPLPPPPPPPPPKPPEPPESAARAIRPSAETHFQPIRRASGDQTADDAGDEAAAAAAGWPAPATYEPRLYTRSDSGGLYLEDEEPRPAAHPPQKYMIYQEEAPAAGCRRGLAPKFKLSCNEKYCQTDEPAPADSAGRDLLQILVSEEQAGEARGARPADDADNDDDDSSYEVLSSLQQTLHSIYENGSDTADSGAEPELERRRPAAARPLARRQSAFARVVRPPASHRPLYLRGGGADSLLAAVYTGGAWSPDCVPPAESADHRPLYARQPAGGGGGGGGGLSEFAEHRQLSSGVISGAVYRQGPTEYPALRYQLAGRDLPEVTFCRLSGDTHRSGSQKEDSLAGTAAAAVGSEPSAGWEEAGSDALRSSREPSVGSDTSGWPAGSDAGTLWQAAGEREQRDRSADRALWEARAEPGRRRSSVDSAIWEPEPAAPLWETPRALPDPEVDGGVLWEAPRSLAEAQTGDDCDGWERPGDRVERESSVEMTIWKAAGEREEGERTTDSEMWPAGGGGGGGEPAAAGESAGDTLWAPRELTRRELSIDEALWESHDGLSQPETAGDESVDAARDQPDRCSRRDGSAEKTIWESAEERPPRDASAEKSVWPPPAGWRSSAELSGERPSDGASWKGKEAAGWPVIRAPERIWRRSEPPDPAADATAAGAGGERMRRLLWRLGGDDVLAQTGLYHADELADAGRNWEFIDENNVKNKIDATSGDDSGPLASELSGGGWRLLPALRQLSESLGLSDGGGPALPELPDGVALQAWALEEQWRRDDGPPRPARDRRTRRSDRKRPCSYFMEGNCKRNDCKFSHDLSAITCVFWEESGCFKGVHCPFLHGYPADDEEDEDSSDSAKRAVPKKSFKLEKEDFPSLHNMKTWHRNDEEDSRRAGRRSCRRHKSFSDASLGVGGGDGELHRPALGGRGKRRRHHSKSEGVRPTDTGARRP